MGLIQLDSQAAIAIKDRLVRLNQQQYDLFAKMNGYLDAANAAWAGPLAEACKNRQQSIRLDTGTITDMFNRYIAALEEGVQALVEAERILAVKMAAGNGAILAGLGTGEYYGSGNISFRGGYKGQCTWYAYGRFKELTGISLPTAPHAKKWLDANDDFDQVTVTHGAASITAPSIAVSKTGGGGNGHVIIVEHVELDENGNPATVYFSEANNSYVKPDGKMQSLPYAEFVRQKNPAGYISKKAEP